MPKKKAARKRPPRRKWAPSLTRSKLEMEALLLIRAAKLPMPKEELRFDRLLPGEKPRKLRMWRLDFAWPDIKLAVEIHGLNPGGKSRHLTIEGYGMDRYKMNRAQLLGWMVLEFTGMDVQTRQLYVTNAITRAYHMRREEHDRLEQDPGRGRRPRGLVSSSSPPWARTWPSFAARSTAPPAA